MAKIERKKITTTNVREFVKQEKLHCTTTEGKNAYSH